MALLLKEYKRERLPLLLLSGLLLIFLSLNLIGSYSKTIGFLSCYYAVFPALFCCFLLSDNDEVELLLTYPKKKAVLFFTKYAAFVSFAAVGAAAVWGSFHTSCRFLLSLSFIVTFLFMTSLAILLRLTLRSAYGAAGFLFIGFLWFYFTSDAIGKQELPVWRAYFDPYITSYMIGTRIWIINRLLFLTVTLTIWLICFLLLKREKLLNR